MLALALIGIVGYLICRRRNNAINKRDNTHTWCADTPVFTIVFFDPQHIAFRMYNGFALPRTGDLVRFGKEAHTVTLVQWHYDQVEKATQYVEVYTTPS